MKDEEIVAGDATHFDLLLAHACRRRWVVYAKPPFGGPREVLQYLAAYTHRTAISNRRIVSFEKGEVSFGWRDYADENKQKVMTLPVLEFLRRFLLHILPARFVRIRYFGFLGNHNRRRNIDLARTLLGTPVPPPPEPEPDPPRLCPQCREGKLRIVAHIEPVLFTWSRPPPTTYAVHV